MNDNNLLFKKEKYSLQNKWRRQHSILMYIFSGILFAVEVIMMFFIPILGVNYSSFQQYVFKYVITPGLCYFLINILVYLLTQMDFISFSAKNYIVSLGLATICLLMCFMHDIFVVIFASGILAIFLTAIYSEILLTVVTTIYLFIGELLIGFFNTWDPGCIKDATYRIDICSILLMLVGSCLFSIAIIRWEEKRLIWISKEKIHMNQLQKQASIDPLTNLQNRRSLRKFIDTETFPITFAMTDVNKFKIVNDTFGHNIGDELLVKLGEISIKHSSDKISAFRYGGDEFLYAFTNTNLKDVQKICEKIQNEFSDSLSNEIRAICDGISVGIAEGSHDELPRDTLHRADEALYIAKKSDSLKLKIL